MKTGKLYVIGVGPGDPELLTLKAVRILREMSCICVPKGREEGSSLALSIAERAVSLAGKEIIEAHFPMQKSAEARKRRSAEAKDVKSETSDLPDYRSSGLCKLDTKWHETVENVLSRLSKGIDVAFITIGDPSIYSTFFYLFDRLLELDPELTIEMVPGVSSINAAASRAGISLGLADEKIAILPATYTDNLKEVLEKFDTVVLMKVHRVFESVIAILDSVGLSGNAIYVSRAGMEDEKIFRKITDVGKDDLNYFSMVIVRK